jgi:hypothetical protein
MTIPYTATIRADRGGYVLRIERAGKFVAASVHNTEEEAKKQAARKRAIIQ